MAVNLVLLAAPQIDPKIHFPTLKQKIFAINSASAAQQPISSLMKQVEERQNVLNQTLKMCGKLQREIIDQSIQKFADVESYLNLELKQIQAQQSRSQVSSPTSSASPMSGRAINAPIQRPLADYTQDSKYTNYHRLLALKRQQEATSAASLQQRSAEKLLEQYKSMARINEQNRQILQPAALVVPLQGIKQLVARFDEMPGAVPDTLQELGRDGQSAAFGCIAFRPELTEFKQAAEKELQAAVKLFDFNAQPTDNTIFDQFAGAQRAYNDHLLVSSSAVARAVAAKAYERCVVEASLRFGAQNKNILAAVVNAKELLTLKKELKQIFAEELAGDNLYDEADDGFLPYVIVNCHVWG